MMINPPKPPEGPKPTRAMLNSHFELKSTTTPAYPPPMVIEAASSPPASCTSLQAVASSQDPLINTVL